VILLVDNYGSGLRYREYPAFGLQFYPESIATLHGGRVMANYLHHYCLERSGR